MQGLGDSKSATRLKTLFLTAMALVLSFSAAAQQGRITLPVGDLGAAAVFEQIRLQTDYRIAADADHTAGLRVRIARGTIEVKTLLDRLLAGSGMGYRLNGNYIVIKEYPTETQPTRLFLPLTGTVVDRAGRALEGVTVEVVDGNSRADVTTRDGRFRLESVSTGRHVIRLALADGSAPPRYREVEVTESGAQEPMLVYDADRTPPPAEPEPEEPTRVDRNRTAAIATPMPQPEAPMVTASTEPVAYVPATASSFASGYAMHPYSTAGTPFTEMYLIPNERISQADKPYLPKAAFKTNLLYLATTTLNAGVEFGLARKWSFQLDAAYNPFRLQKKGTNLFWFTQPELRFWFCQRFEKHFIGLHGIYGTYNIGEVDFLTTTIMDHRYKGQGVGGGIAWGFHRPIGKRWAWEFQLGAGVVFLDYDKYKCYECDELEASKNKAYVGPTKATVSLIFMIK